MIKPIETIHMPIVYFIFMLRQRPRKMFLLYFFYLSHNFLKCHCFICQFQSALILFACFNLVWFLLNMGLDVRKLDIVAWEQKGPYQAAHPHSLIIDFIT